MVQFGNGVGSHCEPQNPEPDGWDEAHAPAVCYDQAANDELVFVELLPPPQRRAVEARRAAQAQAARERRHPPRSRKLITPVRRARTEPHERSPSRRSRKTCRTSAASKDPPPSPSPAEITLMYASLLPRRQRARVVGAMQGWWS